VLLVIYRRAIFLPPFRHYAPVSTSISCLKCIVLKRSCALRETIRRHSARPICSTRLIKEWSQERQGAANEHRCRRVAGGPFDLRGTLAEPLGLEAHYCLLALDSFLTFSTIRDRRIFSRPRQHPRRPDFLRLWDTCITNSTVSTCINHENRFPLRIWNT